MKAKALIILSVILPTLIFGWGFCPVKAVAPTPPSRQGYSSSVYFEATTYDFDESGGTGNGIGRYTKVQRVSVRFTDLASGLVLLTPSWDSSVTSSIKQLVTSNIRCYECTVTYSNDKFYIRPAGTMQCTFEVLYPNYATSSLSFNTTPYFTFTASSFDDSGLLGYELPVYDRLVHSDLTALYTETHAINTIVSTLGSDISDIAFNTSNTNAELTVIEQKVTGLDDKMRINNGLTESILNQLQNTSAGQTSITENSQKQTTAKTDSNTIHTIDGAVLDSMDTALNNPALNVDIVSSINSEPNAQTTFQWVATQMQHIVSLGQDITPMWEFMFVAPLVVGVALMIIGRSVKS